MRCLTIFVCERENFLQAEHSWLLNVRAMGREVL
jgi:hypothetical protein